MSIRRRVLVGLVGLVVLAAACGDNIHPGAIAVSLAITPEAPAIAKGTKVQLTATVTYSDHHTEDVTANADWVTSSSEIAMISVDGTPGLVRGVAIGAADLSATFTDARGHAVTNAISIAVLSAKLASVEVTPAAPSVAQGTSVQLTATGVYSDNSTADITASATWTTSNSTVATVAAGLASGLAVGSATITATQDGVAGGTTLTVTAVTLVTIEVTPTTPSIAKGTTQPFTATGVFSDSSRQNLTSQVTWSSSTTSVADISSAGLATANDVGTSMIEAQLGTVTGVSVLTVTSAVLTSIEVSPADPTLPKGTQQQMTATGVYSDSTTQDLTASVTWESGTPTTATISAGGLVAALAQGTTVVTATDAATSVFGSTTVTVSVATLMSIEITPADSSVANGTSLQFVAEGVYSDLTTVTLTDQVTWSSDMTGVATISNASGSQGFALAVGTGTATITATDPTTMISGSTTLTVSGATLVAIEVDPANETLPRGTGENYMATGIYSDFTTQDLTTTVTWASSNTAAATISNASGTQGAATTLAAGTTTISATDPTTMISGSAKLVVGHSVLLSMVILPANPTVAKGARLQFTCIGTYDDGTVRDITQFVTWASSKPGTASVSNAPKKHGLAQGKIAGMSTISVTDPATGLTASTVLTVTNATLSSITIAPLDDSIPNHTRDYFTAVGHYSDGTTSDFTSTVSWSSSNTGVASISNQNFLWGLAQGVGVGTTTITALDVASGVSASTTLTVTSATLVSITITPVSPNAILGVPMQLTATGKFSDNSMKNITQDVTWLSSDTTKVTVLNVGSTRGTITGQAVGTATISANYPQTVISATDGITVIP